MNSEQASVKARRILIVDDNPDVANMLAANLGGAGHEVSVATNGKDALERARASVPDVVLLDIGMAGVTGYDVARTLRENAETRGVLLIAVTGWAGEGNRQRAMEAGFDHHLTKPVKTAELLSIIEEHKKPA